MYWRVQSSRMPRPDWDRETVCRHLPAFLPVAKTVNHPEIAAYCHFYGLDLETRNPDISHHLGYLNVGSFRVALHEYCVPQSRGTVFVVHGYFDHAGLYGRLFAHLLEQGYNVVCYDLPGHGLSSGETAAIRSFADYQRVLGSVMDGLRNRAPGPWFAIGQSTGGAVLIDYLLGGAHDRTSSEFQEVILLAPLVRPMGWSLARVLHTLVRPFRSTWKRAFSRNSGSERFLRFLREEDPLQSQVLSVTWVGALKEWIPRIEAAQPVSMDVTVIQGERDLTVDWPHNLDVIGQKFPGSRFHRLPEGHHHLVNEAPPLLDELFLLIDRALSGSHASG